MKTTKYSIVVPVYKSSASLFKLSSQVDAVFSTLSDADYELVFVNDSPFSESTVEALSQIHCQNSRVIVVELMRNFGQQPATLCGIECASGDFIITMDDDLQHAPEDIPLLMEKSAHDVVIAKFKEKKHSSFKRFTSWLKGYFDQIILGKPKSIKLSSFRLVKAEIAKLMFKRKTPYPFIPALLFDITRDIVNVEIEHHSRQDGSSHYTLVKMIRVFSNLIINNSSFLLRMVGYIGLAVSLLAIIMGIVLIIKKLFFAQVVAGWTSLAALILFFGGLILLTLGVTGEYLIRIIATTEDRPVYYVRSVLNDSKK
jgi:dolichol-phosphate mannosyltransferase/undecaprenyl-phosphate 4-deoxy-4-formamido-L-arabinose transferase